MRSHQARYTRTMARPDPHSVFDTSQPRVRHLDWRARLDFVTRTIHREARLLLDGDGELLDLDSRDLAVEQVTDDAGARLDVERGAPHPFLGQRVRIARPRGVTAVRIRYRTSPQPIALQWSNQSVYSQCQPIYARSLVPLPDSPAARVSFRAELTAPRSSTALMAAAFVGRSETAAEATTAFEMVEPIPPYLLALAVGPYVARELSHRSRVWAAAGEVDRATRRFAEIERLLAAAEALLGPYRWRRFDVLVAPASFPYGGMENPTLAFVAPSLLDGEGVPAVVLHELVHAWSGNLVTAASAEHFWLNEAFTVWAERRLLSELAGPDVAVRHEARGRQLLEQAFAAFASQPELTRLRLALTDLDPDAAMSIIPYEKGYLLLRALELRLGRAPFAALVREYLDCFALCSITTDDFAAFMGPRVPGFSFADWFDQSGLPPSAPPPPPDAATGAAPTQWSNQSDEHIERLCRALQAGDDTAMADVEAALAPGRVKHLRPLYLALAARSATRALAPQLYRRLRTGYHPIARQQIERLFRELGLPTQEVNPLSLARRT
jgi:aminopeptidase N